MTIGAWVVTNTTNNNKTLLRGAVLTAGLLATGIGLLVGARFGLAAAGLTLAAVAQIAEMADLTDEVQADTDVQRRVKAFAGAMKLLGLLLLGIGGMVGISEAPSEPAP
jgi:hypothetical protein